MPGQIWNKETAQVYVAIGPCPTDLYVGMTSGPVKRRMTEHRCYAKSGGRGPFFDRIREIGIDVFHTVSVFSGPVAACGRVEAFLVEELRTRVTGLNHAKGGVHPSGYKFNLPREFVDRVLRQPKSEETKARISAARKGWVYSDETKAKMSAAQKKVPKPRNPNTGRFQ